MRMATARIRMAARINGFLPIIYINGKRKG